MRRRAFIAALGGAAAWPVVGACPGRKGTRLRSYGVRRCSQAISPCIEAVRVAVIAEIFGCSPAAA